MSYLDKDVSNIYNYLMEVRESAKIVKSKKSPAWIGNLLYLLSSDVSNEACLRSALRYTRTLLHVITTGKDRDLLLEVAEHITESLSQRRSDS